MRFVNDEEFLRNPFKYLKKDVEGESEANYYIRAILRLPLESSDHSVDVTRYPKEFVVWIPLVAETRIMQERIDSLLPQCKAVLENTAGLGLVEAELIRRWDNEEFSTAHIHLGNELVHCANSTYEVWRRVDRSSRLYLIPRNVWMVGWADGKVPTKADVVIRVGQRVSE